ncbi:winged helix-turn-helix domain-containing protein [Haloferax chudinovii]|uniref:Winged helix-turn-helix domain-containing protein n=1 Tax=Haloferax chudinovii TaxID=1109010 RepID=A0ABD5XJ72_9EURY
MRKPGEWMQMPIDERILEALDTSEMILSPAVIAKNIDKTRSEVNRRLSVLVEQGFVTRVERGYYEIADRGSKYLSGDFDASALDDEE